jgi:hypothetical protein
MRKCLLFIGMLFTACSEGPVGDTPGQAIVPTVSKERRDELKTAFGRALAPAMADSASLRKLIKEEALTMFDRDYDVLYHMIKDRPLEDGRTVREFLLGYFETEEQLAAIEKEVPLLTIFVPELPKNSFSASLWNVDTQVPSVGITSYKTNDVNVIKPEGEEFIVKATDIPGFPVVVIKENERVVQARPAGGHQAMAKGKVFQTSDNMSFAFLADCFDGSISNDKSESRSFIGNPDPKLLEAYNIYLGTDGWHRDYIYYNITPTQDRGPFSYAYQERIRSFSMVGDPASAYSKIADQTGDPRLASVSLVNAGWTGGFYEFKVRVLLNAKNGIGEEFITYFSALPDELFAVTYDPYIFNLYRPRITGLNVKGLSLPLFSWDLNDYASTIKIEIEEVDVTETVINSESRTVKFATNFSIDPTAGLLKKIGLKFGASLEETRTQTTQRTYTLGNDLLGSVIVNFADNVLVGRSTLLGLTIWRTREYASGWYSISVEPTRVQ